MNKTGLLIALIFVPSISFASLVSCQDVFTPIDLRRMVLQLAELRMAIDEAREAGNPGLRAQILEADYNKKLIELSRSTSVAPHELTFEIRRSIANQQTVTQKAKLCDTDEKSRTASKPDGSKIIFNTMLAGSISISDQKSTRHLRLKNNFEMASTLVTQFVWRNVVELAIARDPVRYGSLKPHPSYEIGNQLPVESVSHDQVLLWIDALNQLIATEDPTVLSIFPGTRAGTLMRLPTEAEWDYTVHSTSSLTHLGSPSKGANELDNFAWHWKNSGFRTRPVATKDPLISQEHAFYDLYGNVSEWTSDHYRVEKPTGIYPRVERPQRSEFVARGGSYASEPNHLSDEPRIPYVGKQGYSNVGFRLVRVPVN